MRIGILTLPLMTNYGGILQAYALQTILQRMGYEVGVITLPVTRRLPWLLIPYSYPKRMIKRYLFQKKVDIFVERTFNREYPIVSKYTQSFIDKHIKQIKVKKISDLLEKDFDAIVVGSDQIWRPMYYPQKIEQAYLNFTHSWNIRRVAYAASFGTENWEYSFFQTIHCRKLIRKFNAVSVREDTGRALCSRHLNIAAVHVVDPTMLLTKEDYISLFELVDTPPSKGNMLNYILDETEESDLFLKNIAATNGWLPFRVNSKVENPNASISERIQPSVEQWLRGFYDAEFVVTDSFHACVFSIIFNKPFIVIGNAERGLTRFESLLRVFGLEDHLLYHFSDYNPNHSYSINVKALNTKLVQLRNDSLKFLLDSLQK